MCSACRPVATSTVWASSSSRKAPISRAWTCMTRGKGGRRPARTAPAFSIELGTKPERTIAMKLAAVKT